MHARIAVCAALLFGAGSAWAQVPDATAGHVEGWISVIRGDAVAGAVAPEPLFMLRQAGGITIRLQPQPDTLGAMYAYARNHVLVYGSWTVPTQTGTGTLRVTAISPTNPSGAAPQPAAPTLGAKPWINVLCRFSDVADEQRAPEFFDAMMSSTRPGLDHYWREQSAGQLTLAGSTHTRWYGLPYPYSHYVHDVNGDGIADVEFEMLRQDCMGAADAAVNFPDYAGINLVFNRTIGCCAWGGATFIDVDGQIARPFGLTWLPPWAWENHTAMAHEMGHGFGLPHSQGRHLTYQNPWDVMSDIWFHCDQAQDPVLGCLGYHTIALHKDLLGWIGETQHYVAAPGVTQTLRLERLERPTATPGYLIARIPIRGSSTHFYTVEARRRFNYDTRLMGSGVVIHEVDLLLGEPANVVDGDVDNANPYDEGTRWIPGEVFRDDANGIRVSVDVADATGYTVTISRASDLIFADGFESGDLAAWSTAATGGGDLSVAPAAALAGTGGLRANLDDATQLYVGDARPLQEKHYRARFRFDPNSIVMADNDRHLIFNGWMTGSAAPVVSLELLRKSGKYWLRGIARTDAGSLPATSWQAIADAPHDFEFDWTASTASWLTDGTLTLWVDGVQKQAIADIDNDTLAVDFVRLGALGGIDPGTRGAYFFDAFESRNETYIGPVAP